MLRRHDARLRAVVRSALLLAMGGAGAVAACDEGTRVIVGDAALPDATVVDAFADSPADAPFDSDAGSLLDAPSDATDALDADAQAQFPLCDDAAVSAPYFPDTGSDAAPCYYYVDFSCGKYPPLGNDCHLAPADCMAACTLDAALFECLYLPTTCAHGDLVADAGQTLTLACGLCPGGRRPAGLVPPRTRRAATVAGAYFAHAAYLEAASVHAFERVARELRAHGASPCLVDRATRAAADEVRHAAAMGALARRCGSRPPAARLRRTRERSLGRMLCENAAEGCVRETFGAAVAAWQAAHATDPRVRRAMGPIAREELRHAALAWAVDAWAQARLSPRERAAVARARKQAIRSLSREIDVALPVALTAEAGLPRRREARRIFQTLVARLWVDAPSAPLG